MQTVNKKNSTYYAMALLLVGLTITPVSLKAVGFSPNLSAGVNAWRQIASVFGDNHQPATSAELLALNDSKSDQPQDAQPEQPEQCLFAETRPMETAIASESVTDVSVTNVVAQQAPPPSTPRRRCPLAASRRASATEAIAEDTVEKQVNAAMALRVRAVEAVEAAKQNALASQKSDKSVEKQIAQCRIDINDVLKSLPVKDGNVLVRLREIAAPFILHNFEYNFHAPLFDARRRQRASRAPVIVQTSSIPEDTEL